MSTPSPRQVDYNAIAHLYDAQPYRDKQPDPALLDHALDKPPNAILDLCAGTGNQLLANRRHFPHAFMVGLDLSLGMLRQARPKSRDIHWSKPTAPTRPLPTTASTTSPTNSPFTTFTTSPVPPAPCSGSCAPAVAW